MIEYFDSKEKCDKLIEIAKSWIGTPYHHCWHVKGRGADCSLFIAEVYKECGILDDFKIGYYPTDWHINAKIPLLENTIKNVRFKDGYRFKKVAEPKCGDILTFSFVKTGIAHHSALYLENGKIIQAGKGGVAVVDYDNRWQRHLKSIYRVAKW